VFVSGLATRVIEVRNDGTLTDYLGTYDEYLESQGIDG
jgi:ATPase subunit of ABC transporter with duplicated ATPase domains